MDDFQCDELPEDYCINCCEPLEVCTCLTIPQWNTQLGTEDGYLDDVPF